MKAKSVMIALALAIAVAVPAQGQSKTEIALKVERLEREMIALENRVRSGQPVDDSADTPGERQLLADMVAKVGTLERQLRTLTGRLEEIEFHQRQTDEALEMLRREMALDRENAARAQVLTAPAATPLAKQEGTAEATNKPAEKPAITTPKVTLPAGDAAAQYQYAFDFIQKNDLDSGFTAMEMFLKANPTDERIGNAKFWLGRIHLLKGRMPQAAQQLLALIEEHPNHPKRVDALVDLADVLLALDSASDACNALAEFRRSDAKATERLKARADRTASQAKCSF